MIAGHGRLQAALQLEMRTVPVIELTGLSAAEKRAYLLADNRIAEDAGWDKDLLATEFSALKDMGFDLALTGFDPDAIDALLSPPPSAPSEPPTPALPAHAVSELGDVWVMGNHRLICGDVTKPSTYKALTRGELAQMVFTDPPYGVSYEASSGVFETIKGDDLRRGQLTRLLHEAFANAMDYSKENAGWYVWHASFTRDDFSKALRDQGLVEMATIIWAKPAMVLSWSDYKWSHEPCLYLARQGVRPAWYGDRSATTVWRIAARTPKNEPITAIGTGVTLTTESGAEIHVQIGAPKGRKVRQVQIEDGALLSHSGSREDDVWEVARDNGRGRATETHHPTQKPVELARRAILNSSTEGDIVLDMFAGSCTTLIGCEQLNRRCFTIELDPRYVDVGVERWQKFTGKEAKNERTAKTWAATPRQKAKARSKA